MGGFGGGGFGGGGFGDGSGGFGGGGDGYWDYKMSSGGSGGGGGSGGNGNGQLGPFGITVAIILAVIIGISSGDNARYGESMATLFWIVVVGAIIVYNVMKSEKKKEERSRKFRDKEDKID